MTVPLDDGLAFSSLLREDDAVFKTFMVLLSRVEADSVSRVSSDFLARVTGKSPEEIGACLKVLAEPDPSSRTTTDDGRRIERVDGGFKILNAEKYREKAREEQERIQARERQRKHREREAFQANPIVAGRRPELELEVQRLVTEIHDRTGEDPIEVIARASSYQGMQRGAALNPASMSDDRLAHTLRDLRADAAQLRKKANGGT